MKQLLWTLMLIFVVISPLAACAQSLPEDPAPAPTADPMWARVQNLKPGTPIVVSDTYGPPVRCLFAAATEAYLDCSPAGNPPATGFRFHRVDVTSVELDHPAQFAQQNKRKEHNYHPAWFASMIAGGCLVGFAATHTTDAGHAAEAGAISALAVGAIGAPLAFLPRDRFMSSTQPQFSIGIPFPARLTRR